MARKQNFPIVLSEAEREKLERTVKTGNHSARERQRAQTLLWSDAGKTDRSLDSKRRKTHGKRLHIFNLL